MTDDTNTDSDRQGKTAADLRAEDNELDQRAKDADREGRKGIAPAFRSVDNWGWLNDDHVTPEPRPLLKDSDDLWLPREKVGMVAAPGGTGKTRALLQLAIAVATGRKWLDTYEVEAPGHVVCALAETAPEDFDRMLNNTVDALELDGRDRDRLKQRLWALPLDGRPVGLMEDPTRKLRMYQRLYPNSLPNELRKPDGSKPDLDALYYTERRNTWEQLLEDNAPEEGWRLVILDPASRFIGPDVEKDNAAATRFVELLEEWKNNPGLADRNGVGPTVLVSHHVNKRSTDDPIEMLYNQGAARGSSALTDGVRWQLNMNFGHVAESSDELAEYVVMRAAKSNHGRKGDEIWISRDDNGVLEPYDGSRGELMGPTEVAEWRKNRNQANSNNVTNSPNESSVTGARGT